MEDIDAGLDLLLSITEQIADSFETGRLDPVGELLKKRGEIIRRLSSCSFSREQTEQIHKVVRLGRRIDELAGNYKKDLLSRQSASLRMRDGLIGYRKTNSNLSSGQIVDKKR